MHCGVAVLYSTVRQNKAATVRQFDNGVFSGGDGGDDDGHEQ